MNGTSLYENPMPIGLYPTGGERLGYRPGRRDTVIFPMAGRNSKSQIPNPKQAPNSKGEEKVGFDERLAA
jgi:hypothetical protein